MSIVARAHPGSVLAESPPVTVVITEVMSGRPAVRPSIRSTSCASAVTALRPRAVSAPAWAARPCRCSVRQIAPLRAETRSPLRRPHSNTSAAAAPRAWSQAAGARSRTSSSAQTSRRSSENGRAGSAASRSIAIAASTSPPFMSATPGPVQRSPSRRNRQREVVPGGNTVSGWPSSATAGPPSPGTVRTRLRAGLSGSSTHVWTHPAGASHAAICSATASCSVPPDGESVSTSACSRAQKTSVGEAAKARVTLPGRTNGV